MRSKLFLINNSTVLAEELLVTVKSGGVATVPVLAQAIVEEFFREPVDGILTLPDGGSHGQI